MSRSEGELTKEELVQLLYEKTRNVINSRGHGTGVKAILSLFLTEYMLYSQLADRLKSSRFPSRIKCLLALRSSQVLLTTDNDTNQMTPLTN